MGTAATHIILIFSIVLRCSSFLAYIALAMESI